MDFLASQKQFSVETRSSLEVVLVSGQKIQFDHTARQSVQRPNKLRAERTGDLVDQVFYYDGKSLTLHNPSEKYYATVAAPGTLEEMLDFARSTLDIVAPAGDLVYKNAYEILMTDVTSGFVVGKGVVEGVRCDHLAFRAPHVDWQIWIQEGSQPLPRKLVITTRDVVNAPAVLGRRDEVEPQADVHRPDVQLFPAERREESRVRSAREVMPPIAAIRRKLEMKTHNTLKPVVLGLALPLLLLVDVSPEAPLSLTLAREAAAIVGAPVTPVSVAGVAGVPRDAS